MKTLLLLSLFTLLSSGFAQDFTPSNSTIPSAQAAASAVVARTNSMEVLDNTRRLAIGDLLSYRVVEDRGNTVSSLIVTDSGEVEVPLIGRVAAKGKTCKTVAHELKSLLEEEYYRKATVILALNFTGYSDIGRGGKSYAATQDQITVMGAVGQAGRIFLPSIESHYSLSQAILDAGGLGRFANAKKVQIVRRPDPENREKIKRYIVNLHDVMKKGQLEKDMLLLPNDVVIVPEKFLNF